jgi:hypothetical protein
MSKSADAGRADATFSARRTDVSSAWSKGFMDYFRAAASSLLRGPGSPPTPCAMPPRPPRSAPMPADGSTLLCDLLAGDDTVRRDAVDDRTRLLATEVRALAELLQRDAEVQLGDVVHRTGDLVESEVGDSVGDAGWDEVVEVHERSFPPPVTARSESASSLIDM